MKKSSANNYFPAEFMIKKQVLLFRSTANLYAPGGDWDFDDLFQFINNTSGIDSGAEYFLWLGLSLDRSLIDGNGRKSSFSNEKYFKNPDDEPIVYLASKWSKGQPSPSQKYNKVCFLFNVVYVRIVLRQC